MLWLVCVIPQMQHTHARSRHRLHHGIRLHCCCCYCKALMHASTPWKVFESRKRNSQNEFAHFCITSHTLAHSAYVVQSWQFKQTFAFVSYSKMQTNQIVPTAALNATPPILTFKMPPEFVRLLSIAQNENKMIVFISIVDLITILFIKNYGMPAWLCLCSNFQHFREFFWLIDKQKMKHHDENRASIPLHRMFDWSGIIIIGKRSNHKKQFELDFNCFSSNEL